MAPAVAHEDHAPYLEEIVVYGRAKQVIGEAQSASEGVVGYDDIQLLPLLRVGELAESVPGMVATQHSGTGKANQYFLRGFNLDHGTDFSGKAEGVPLNMRTHGHGQGYLDLNFLIPELVATTTYRKGPYSVSDGDFSSAGSAEFSFYDHLDSSIAELGAGENGYYRGLLAGSAGKWIGALDVTRYDGPWVLPEGLEQEKAYLSYVSKVGDREIKLTAQGYWGNWDATDQIPERAVDEGLISPLGYIDPDLGGNSHRVALTGRIDYGDWRAGAYFIDYDFRLFSNFTYWLDNPAEGDEFEQRDARRVYGGYADAWREATWGGRTVNLHWGAELRLDDIPKLGLYHTDARAQIGTVRNDNVTESSLGVYGEAEWQLADNLRTTLGLRADGYGWDVDALRPENSGIGHDQILSPKFSLAYRPTENIETYFDYGRGMHSNDVRGATISVDPVSGDPVDPVEALVPSTGTEVGMRVERGRRFNATFAVFRLDLDSELVFVGDAGGTEPNDASHRLGVEVTGFWQANDWLAINAAWTRTRARFTGVPEDEDHIPGAIESTASVGLNAAWENGFFASLRYRYLGVAPLIEDDSVRSEPSTLVNAAIAYRHGLLEYRLEVFNLFDSSDYDISYYYASRLPGEPLEGVSDIHFHPLEPRTVRATIKLSW
jgi:outer membrane receptor protein involved in Fe transport